MAFLRTFELLLFCLLSQAKCEIYHITPKELEVADNCNSSCITLSQLAASTPFVSSNITLIFLPGSHNLTENLTFSNIDYISIAANNFAPQITCELSTHLAIENVQYAGISDLEFFGCGSNFIRNVAEFVLLDVLFHGNEESSTALQLIETTATLVATTFLSNTRGTLTGNGVLYFFAGGAIIATHTNIFIRDGIFERNRAEVGGVIYADQNSTLSAENTTFVNNQALFQSSTVEPALGMGGVLYQESGSVTITNCLFTNNSAPNFSGGVVYSNKSDLYIKASQFADSSASNGSIIFSYNGSVSIDSSQFNRNTATWGGVIQSSNSNVLIDRSQFSDNRVTMGGGIVHSLGGTVTLNDGQFHSSMATWGGILYTNEHSKFMISQSQFNGSIATMEGGVFYCNTGDIEIQSSQFYNNSANSPDNEFPPQGGVLYSLNGNVHINNSQFHSSAGTYYGGALISISGNVSISNSQFSAHKATYGGAISLFSSNIIIEDSCQFDHNSAVSGGAVYAFNSNIRIRDGSEFNSNTASDQGGAILMIECKVSINSSDFHWNSAATEGGALYSADGRVNIEGSKFKYNSALNGGAMNVFKSQVSLKGTEISSNMATNTAGVLFGNFDSNIVILDSILNNNTATVSAGSLYCSCSSVMIQASILNNNTATRAGVLESSDSDITVDDCRMIGNNASVFGGVLYTFNSNIIVRNSHVNHSRVNIGQGGVFYSINSRMEIYESIFHNNRAALEGGVMYSRTSNIIVNGSHFSGNIAIFNAAVAFTENDVVTIYDSFFMDNCATIGAVMHANNSNVSVDISQFVDNSALSGGVIESFLDSNITLERSQFYDNRADSLGAVLRTNRGYFEIRHSQFHNNTCSRLGGVILCIRSQYTIKESQFTENRALDGSVLYTLESSINMHSISIHNNTGDDGTFYLFQSTITVSNTSFTSNIGSFLATDTVVNFTNFNSFESCMSAEVDRINFQEGGALTAFQSTIYFEGTTTFDNNQADYGGAIHSTESVLNITGTTLVSQNLATRHGGGVFLSESEVFCQPSSLFRLDNNTARREGGGIYAVGSTIQVSIVTNETLVSVVGNVAKRGGGLALNSNAKLYVLKRMSFNASVYAVQITDNSAILGGAFFVSDESNAASCESPSTECFLQVLAIHHNERHDVNTVAFYVSNNSAKRSASSAALYGGLLDRCTVSPLAEVHSRLPDNNIGYYLYNGSGLDYFLDSTEITPDIITSEAVKVCFCFNGFHNCSHLDPEIRVVKKGEPFVVSVTAVDQVGQPVTSKLQSSLMFTQSGLAEGQLLQDVTDKCNDLTFNVFSLEKNETLTLLANGPCKGADLSIRSVVVQFLPCACPIGFQPVNFNSTCECECHHSISRYVTCDDQTGSFVRQSVNVWISYSNTSGYLVYPNCPYGYCESPDIGTPITLSQPNGSDAQCTFNRVSTLCASCEPGLSLSLGGPRCLRCPHYWPALVVVIILAAALAGVALVAMLLFLNMTVAVGSLNGIIFYANIVAANRNVFPYEIEPGIASVFISFLNLDIGIDTCFFEGMTTYSKTWLQLLFPLYVIVLVVLLMIISFYSTKFSNLIEGKDSVATLATLILLSYAKLLGISFTVLSPGTLVYEDGSRQTVWLSDATITYFSGVHVPLFLVAIFILIFGILFTAVVFLWQWIVRLPNKPIFAWIRNQKLQIFIETYNNPYTPHRRYWTGMLLLARVIIYLIAAVNVSNDRYLALMSIIFIIVCILCLKGLTRGRVFKNWPIDLLEIFFYFNILLLAIFTWYLIRPSNLTGSPLAALNASVIMALIVLIFIILYHICSYTPLFLKFRETTIGKKLDEAFKSLSATKQKQRKFEPSEVNIAGYRPTNTEGYINTKDSQRSPSQSKPTQSIIEILVQKSGLEMETNAMMLSTVSDQDGKESNHLVMQEKHVPD